VRWLHKAAEGGHPGAQFVLGLRYEQGVGVPKQPAQAEAWFRRGAEQGDSRGQTALGQLYLSGKGSLAQNPTLALEWLRKASAQADGEAMYWIGQMYGQGLGVPQDASEAFRWFEASAWTGSLIGMCVFASAAYGIAQAEKLPEQRIEARKWMELCLRRSDLAPPVRRHITTLRDALTQAMPLQEQDEALTRAAQWKPRPAPR
jgi:hypothetical protein